MKSGTPQTWRVWRILAGAALLAGLVAATCERAGAAAPREYQIKAVFLFNFAKFIEWPAEVFKGDAPFSICILGTDPFGESLDILVSKQVVQGRSIIAHRFTDLGARPTCHILFVNNTSGKPSLEAVFADLGPAPILTVGDHENFTQQGGCLRFFIAEDRVRFEISLKALERSRLKASSRLLSVARLTEKSGK